MAFIPTTDGAELRVEYEIAGNLYNNILHVRNNAGWDAASIQACVNDIQAYIIGANPNVFTDEVEVRSVTLTDVSQFGGSQATSSVFPLLVGQALGTLASVNNAVGIKKDTGKVGRSFWGYLYHPGVPETRISATVIDPVFAAECSQWWDDMRDFLSPLGWGLCLRTKTIDTVPQNPYVLNFITDFRVVNPIVASIKRRLRR